MCVTRICTIGAQMALPPSDPHQLPLEQLALQQPVHQAQLKSHGQEQQQPPRWQPPLARALQWATGVEFGRKRVCAVDALNEENEACGDIVVQPPAQVRCGMGYGQMRTEAVKIIFLNVLVIFFQSITSLTLHYEIRVECERLGFTFSSRNLCEGNILTHLFFSPDD